MGGEIRPDKCSHMVHKMRPTNEWECVKEKLVAPPSGKTTTTTNLDNLWKDMDDNEHDDLDPPGSGLTILLVDGDVAVIKKLSNDDAKENLGMKVQPDGCNKSHLSTLKEKVEEWTSSVDKSQLPARAVWQSYTQPLWASMKYGLGACSSTLAELEDGLDVTDYYLMSRLEVVRNIHNQLR